jgi:hypothetical protein
MTVDRIRIGKLVASANGIQLVSLSPADSAQTRRDQLQRLTADAARTSDKRPVLLILVEQ